MLSTLHQSSLGALYLLMPEKMSDLWASRPSGRCSSASAVIGGMSVVILESLISAWAYKRQAEPELLAALPRAWASPAGLFRHEGHRPLCPGGPGLGVDVAHLLFYLELFGSVALPAILLYFTEVRTAAEACTGPRGSPPSGWS